MPAPFFLCFIIILILFIKNKDYFFLKFFWSLVNIVLIVPSLILFMIIFFPSFFNFFFTNDFFGEEIFKVVNEYKFFVIVSILFTIFFQLYLWLLHDKLVDRLSHWWEKRKTKNKSLV